MEERAALVTGASSGIGLAIARMLAEEGYHVTATARRAEKLAAATAELDHGNVHAVAADVSDEADIRRVVAAHAERFGRLDVLVNNVGALQLQAIEEIATEDLDRLLSINLRQLILFCRECTPLLKAAGAETRNAQVINTASLNGKRGGELMSVYTAAKHGVVGWTKSMNIELARHGVKSTVLCPGTVDTPMVDFVRGSVPAEDMIRPEDLANFVRFLLKTSPAFLAPELMIERPASVTPATSEPR